MLSLLLAAASLTPAFGDATHTELGYAKPARSGGCVARFDTGSVEITQAFNTAARTMINVAVVTGSTDRTWPAGTQLWVKSSFGPAWRARVIDSTPGRVRFAAHHRFVGDLFNDDTMTIMLLDRLNADSRDASYVTVGSEIGGFRGKLAAAADCADSLGI
ncbi:MAG: hypothetical protein DI569_00870 [Sphingopyxis macrogoltabida]|uniref:Uncharacterized protein n=1 Tax=Sphingopyxis macrogoltabida TaxID=33050 RepID=A0A2W5NDN8_SPHMC|nr:MAG: hypothetical protein DI569_00870 [Sphingopyxis macrogoltabida]